MTLSVARRKLAKLLTRQSLRRALALGASLPRSVARYRALAATAHKSGRPLRLIVLPERMGDIVAAEPVARALREAHPDDFLVWVVDRPFADLLRFNPALDDRLEITCLTEWMVLDRLPFGAAKTRLYVDGVHCSWFGWLPLRNPNPHGIDMDTYFEHGSLLEVFALLGLGRALDERPIFHADPDFDPKAWLAAAAPAIDRGFVAFHCGNANDPDRLWPAERFAAAADFILRRTPFGIVELGLEPRLAAGTRVFHLRDRIPLSQQAALLAGARLFLGGDSGFAHLANALDLSAVILLAKFRHFRTYEPFSGPWKQGGCDKLRTESAISDIGQAEVLAAIARRLDLGLDD